jgi:hypothetical protein
VNNPANASPARNDNCRKRETGAFIGFLLAEPCLLFEE